MPQYALIGEKLGHSYSRLIHKRFFELCNDTESTYDLIEIPKGRLSEEMETIASVYKGINVTIPYKLDVMNYLSRLSPEALKIGAVNTISFTPQGALGYNTDFFGLKCTFESRSIDPEGKRVVILGTGGVSKAALALCEDMKASEITFVSTSAPKQHTYPTITYGDNITGDILINCTPVGMFPNTQASPLDYISPEFEAVVDTIYNPCVTRLMEKAASVGATTVSGLYMLVAQGVYSQAIWRGETVRRDIIDIIYNEFSIGGKI